jgi:RNA polymerase sigma factor (sigma-70 family)
MADFGGLIAEQIPALRRYARALTGDPVDADDLVQDCLVRALHKRHLWRSDLNLRGWLFTILHNERITDLRQTAREKNRVAATYEADLTRHSSQTRMGSLLVELDRVVARLPEEQRRAILLVGLEGFDYEEAASILGTPAGTIRSRVSRGRARLRRLLEADAGARAWAA